MDILLATNNQGKVRELVKLLGDLPFNVLSLQDFPEIGEIEEDGETFADNALIKARTAAGISRLLTLADDSGLEVDALEGRPGVHSARFAGEPKDDSENNAKLLELLRDVPAEQRTARFKSVIAVVAPSGEEYLTEGACEGVIGFTPKGTEGFGYDPLFFVTEFDKSFSELTLEEKNSISHRGKALRAALEILRKLANSVRLPE
ncbi:MAG TPA: XTP/dITP diphosphatase [Candidatus Deferrimicrobium sp.]|nr:XTP/dITP diphosphatase [Candidatus Deferrimicrobium sp.]